MAEVALVGEYMSKSTSHKREDSGKRIRHREPSNEWAKSAVKVVGLGFGAAWVGLRSAISVRCTTSLFRRRTRPCRPRLLDDER